MRRFFACAVLLLCGCSTPYQPAGFLGGYSESRLSADSYQVFAEAENEERAGQMVELRAAELTLNSGYQKFIVLRKNVRTETQIQHVPGATYVMAVPTASGGFSGTRTVQSPPQTLTSRIGKGEMTIRMVKASGAGAGAGKAIDAAAVRARLEPVLKKS